VWYKPLLKQMPTNTAKNIKKAGYLMDCTRNPRIMAALFKEDLEWMARGYSERQMNLIIAIALEFAIQNAKDLLNDTEALDKVNGNRERVVERLKTFIDLAPLEIERRREGLDNMKSYELKFYY
jgi:hypothetical protein